MKSDVLIEEKDDTIYPSSDGEPMAETGLHVRLMVMLITLLQLRYRHYNDVYVIGNIFLYYEKGNPSACRSPDVMVVKGVPSTPERDSFKVWIENAVPCVVIELTSEKTREEDQGPKKELYEQLGIREYFLFDPYHDYLPRQLMGYRLHRLAENGENGDDMEPEVIGRYEELPPSANGSLVSQELGLLLVPDGEMLRLVDRATNLPLRLPQELLSQVETYSKEILELRKTSEKTAQQARAEKERAEIAEREAEDAKRLAETSAREAEDARRLAETSTREAEDARRLAETSTRQAEDARRLVETSTREAEDARRLAEASARQAEDAAKATMEEKARADNLECELARLRALLSGSAGNEPTKEP